MEFIELLKKISFDKELLPFNDSFSVSKLKQLLDDEIPDSSIDFIEYLLLSNKNYKQFVLYIDKIKQNQKYPYFFILALSFLNHDCIELSKKIDTEIEKVTRTNNTIVSTDIEKISVDTPLSNHDISSFSDALTDTLDFIFGMLRKGNEIENINPKLTETFTLEDFTFENIHILAEFCVMIKDFFERSSFENLKIKKNNNVFILRDGYQDYSLYRRLGFHRIEQNITMMTQRSMAYSFGNHFCGKYEIQSIQLNDTDELIIKYKNKETQNEILFPQYYVFLSTLMNYHMHLEKEYQDNILHFSELYCSLQYLVRIQMSNIEKMYENTNILPFSRFQFKIKSKNLMEFIHKITGFNLSEIISLLKILENDGHYSFWEKPLLRIKDWFYISIHSLNNTTSTYLIDTWLKILLPKEYDRKGFMFEKFLKKEIANMTQKKNFFSNMVEQQKFKISVGKEKKTEEIDFIWETKNVVIVAEVKCMDYPFTSRITHNDINTLEKASKQIKRKILFLQEYKNNIRSIDLSKKILPCIIINYPCFSGLVIDEIPVIDIGLLINYISVGGIGNCKIGNNFEETTILKPYYNNEDEFSNNLEILLNHSPYLEQLSTHYKKRDKTIQIDDNYSIQYEEYVSVGIKD